MTSPNRDLVTSHRAIAELLSTGAPGAVLLVGRKTPSAGDLVAAAKRRGIAVEWVSRRELVAQAPSARDCALILGGTDSDVTAPASLDARLAAIDGPNALVVLLDHVTDPQNYGAILRSADQFGIDAVIVPDRRSAPLSGAAIDASAGTAGHVPIIAVANLVSAIERLRDAGFWVYGADSGGEPVNVVDLTGRVGLVLGSEGAGMARLVRERCDRLVRIPIHGHADSLNVSVAAGILMYEVRRQQGWLESP